MKTVSNNEILPGSLLWIIENVCLWMDVEEPDKNGMRSTWGFSKDQDIYRFKLHHANASVLHQHEKFPGWYFVLLFEPVVDRVTGKKINTGWVWLSKENFGKTYLFNGPED